jgi:hypothetical protein
MRHSSVATRVTSGLPAYGAVSVEGACVVGVRVTHSVSGASRLTITARGGIGTFAAGSGREVVSLDPDQTYEVATPVNVDPWLLDAIELTVLGWAADERPIRLDWHHRPPTRGVDPGPDYVRVCPGNAPPLVIRTPSAVVPELAQVGRGGIALA